MREELTGNTALIKAERRWRKDRQTILEERIIKKKWGVVRMRKRKETYHHLAEHNTQLGQNSRSFGEQTLTLVSSRKRTGSSTSVITRSTAVVMYMNLSGNQEEGLKCCPRGSAPGGTGDAVVASGPRSAPQEPSIPFSDLSPMSATDGPVFSSSLPLLVEEGVSSPSRDTRTKSSLLRVDTESEDTLIFPTEPLSSMASAVKPGHAAHEWKTGEEIGGR
ncbi:hypothetical protein EYF80_024686 [Liparis tanakae]|uniref:Uncharacterized protein n=1 Tax=Liparis tanakae TaxID=230148 RepID=A0A4Z2HGU3_9TELE|nr:hypothetical protein EYF80_024686 [Liparis tanakae]